MADEDTDTKYVTVNMPVWLNAAIEDELDYGDSKSAWVKDAIVEKLERDREDWQAAPERVNW